ncbi:MAG: citryl-CoA lyase [Burkholderiaceae bacterium]|nr:citryl-CoA lyase [Burkholderiaceae bacterium]
MSDGKQYAWKTAIAEATDTGLTVRGYDMLTDLVGKVDFVEMFYLLLTGKLPTKGQVKVINALFICCAEHGISPSTTVTRFIQAAGVPIQCSVAAGVMMFGDIHGGAGEEFSRDIMDLVSEAQESGRDFDTVAQEYVASRKRISGYGHPQHPSGDPRTVVLFELAEKEGVAGAHIAMTQAIERAIEKKRGRKIGANIDAAVGAISADLGLDWRVSRACIVVPRTAGLFAHAHEEMVREPGWRQIPLSEINYDGPAAK